MFELVSLVSDPRTDQRVCRAEFQPCDSACAVRPSCYSQHRTVAAQSKTEIVGGLNWHALEYAPLVPIPDQVLTCRPRQGEVIDGFNHCSPLLDAMTDDLQMLADRTAGTEFVHPARHWVLNHPLHDDSGYSARPSKSQQLRHESGVLTALFGPLRRMV